MIEIVSRQDFEPIVFKYREDEQDVAAFAIGFFLTGFKKGMLAFQSDEIDTLEAQTRDEKISNILQMQATVVEHEHVAPELHAFVKGFFLPAMIRVDTEFLDAARRNPEITYDEICDGYPVSPDALQDYVLQASDMLLLPPKVEFM